MVIIRIRREPGSVAGLEMDDAAALAIDLGRLGTLLPFESNLAKN